MGASANLKAVPPRAEDWGAVIGRVAEGDEAALAALYDGTSSLVHGLALRIAGDRGVAEEVTADVYLQVWRQAARFDPARGAPLTWLLTLARSRAIDRLRSRASEPKTMEPLAEAAALPSSTPDAEHGSAVDERRRLVARALGTLRPEQQRAIELAYFRGMSHSEIAARLGEPLGTIKTRIRLGMVRLRELLAPMREELL